MVTPWRIGRGWSQPEIEAQLASFSTRAVSVADPPVEPVSQPSPNWTVERFEALLAYELAGPLLPDGPFAHARQAIEAYRFADPRITHGHFDPHSPLLGRNILVHVRVLFLHVLAGLRIGAVLDDTSTASDAGAMSDAGHTRFGIRLDTLTGHLLHGSEWVIVEKDHQRGAVRLRIEVRWRPAPLPAWWMSLGFRLFGRQFQARWRRQAARRLRALV